MSQLTLDSTFDTSDWPLALGGRAGSALFKSTPEDFQVCEVLPFDPVGHGEHLFLRLEKTGQNTAWLARQIGKLADVPAVDVSYAGLKDRQGVTEQSFSVRIPGLPPENEFEQWQEKLSIIDGVRLISAVRHDRKLRTGALEGNHFVIRLRAFKGDKNALETLLNKVSTQGVPNYFGEQRFGNGGHNLIIARKLFSGEIKLAREKRGFALSAARSLIFNDVLGERVAVGTWDQLNEGDVLTFPDARSLIFPDRRDDSIADRFVAGQLIITGPLWGKGKSGCAGAVEELEKTIGARHELFAAGLEKRGMKQERRPLVAQVKKLSWDWDGDDIELRFFLYKGCYATSVVHELVDCRTSAVVSAVS
ncbi:tRNA pseudouridine(13) synthase TruD [Sansalvadorimonas verongulae]|uniref:tRNA pseudouridine(13) synthase TruD n=1 Tax=Sansalvadorimonas verongulae TaxID=2172824 RepID=UPI0012BCDE7B|nr:tRNA pseudouridine(13) synthase TruD [Sansalvadorimonas verongulae]MTI14518.1 tRNA pseudouridine(13) synthase TruD [Sansalvadorimonas verongulae]